MTDLVKDSIRDILYKSLEKTFPSIYGIGGGPSEKGVEVSRSKDVRFGDYATNVASDTVKRTWTKTKSFGPNHFR